MSPVSPALKVDSLPAKTLGKPISYAYVMCNKTLVKTLEQFEQGDQRVSGLVNAWMSQEGGVSSGNMEALRLLPPTYHTYTSLPFDYS